jgi:hypothetical protein
MGEIQLLVVTLKICELKATQISLYFLTRQDFAGFLPNLIVELNGDS